MLRSTLGKVHLRFDAVDGLAPTLRSEGTPWRSGKVGFAYSLLRSNIEGVRADDALQADE